MAQKKGVEVRDMKPSKDIKGGWRRNLDGRSTAGRSQARDLAAIQRPWRLNQ